jgi:site-specific recombinase XerD
MSGTRRTTDRSKKSRAKGSPELLLELIIEEFIFDTQQKTSDGSTPRAYRQPLRLFVRYLSEELGRPPWLSDFALAAVQRWATTLQERPKWERGGLAVGTKPLAVETRRTYLRTLRTFSNWLPRPPHAYCAEPPLKHLILPRASQTYKLPLTDDEITRLIAAAREDTVFGARDTAMLLFLLDGATRAMELCRLRIGDVTLQTGLVLVARGKGNKTRAVTVGDETRLALRRYAVMRDSLHGATRSPEDPFFETAWGGFFTYYGLRSWLKRLNARANVPRAHLHLLRHTSAVDTLDVGADLRTLQLKLGHASIVTTQRYLNMASDRLSERQRAFSPIDHRAAKQSASKSARPPLWHKGKGRQPPPGEEA